MEDKDPETPEVVSALSRSELMGRHARLVRARDLLSRGLDLAMSALEDTGLFEPALETWLTQIATAIGDLEDEEPRHTIDDDIRALQALAEATLAESDVSAAAGMDQEPGADATAAQSEGGSSGDGAVTDCTKLEQFEP